MSGRMVDGWVTDRLALVHNEWQAATRRSQFSGVSEVVLTRRARGGWGSFPPSRGGTRLSA
jgi:hypothetical protein